MPLHLRFRQIVLLLPLAALLLPGCTKEEVEEPLPSLSFAFEYPAMPLTVDSALMAEQGGLVLDLGAGAYQQALSAQGYLPSQVQELTFHKARLFFASPVNSYYDAVKSVHVQIRKGDGQPHTIARLDPVPDGAQTLLLKLTGAEVLRLATADAQLIFSMQFDGPIPQQTQHVLVLGAKVTVAL